MALTQLDYPVTGDIGTFNNIFPSQKPLNINFLRRDNLINTITSGTGGVVRIRTFDVLDPSLQAGDFIVWQTNSYSLRSSRILQRISNRRIDVDSVFNSTDATNGFINYRKNWFLEARFVDESTPTNEQGLVSLVIDNFAQVPNALDGSVSLDVSVIRDVLIPDFDISTGISDGLSKVFKIQYRESYEGERVLPWVSPNVAPANDTPIMLTLGSNKPTFNTFTDSLISQGYFVKDNPTLVSYVYSNINDNGLSNITFSLSQYTLNKTLVSSTDIAVFENESGIFLLFIDPSTIDDNTVFITISDLVVVSNAQFDPLQFDPSQFS